MLLSLPLLFYSANPSPTSIAAPKPPALTTKSAAAPSEVFEAALPDPVAVPEEESPEEEEEEEVVVEVEEDDAATAPELPVVSVAPVPDTVLPTVLDAWVLVAALVVVVSYSVAALQ